jgi:external thioesterase TEII
MNNQQLPQLFLMHYAGGSVYSLNFLKKELEHFFEIINLELPGRGNRIEQELIKDRKTAVEDQLREFNKFRKPNTPVAFYGHSMGALLGFELAKKLEKQNIQVSCLIVTGNAGPGICREEFCYNLPKDEFIIALKEMGGIPDEVYDTEELFDFFEPILRADFEIVEHDYENILEEKINCPIFCVMGSEEKTVSNITNWQNYTHSNFVSKKFSGNHFFINQHSEKLSEFIEKAYHASLVL